MIAGQLEVVMLANLARLQSDMTQAKGMVGGAMKNIESAVGTAKAALASLGIGLGVGYFVSLIKGTIDAADHFNDLTQSMGINRAELAKYQLATAQSGTTLEGLGKGIKGLTTAFAEHGDELRAAGINAKTADGRVRQLADIFSRMPDGLEKTTLATKLFGKSGMELIPMLNMGAAGLDEAAAKSAKYAAVMATLAPQADQFNDLMAELGMASKVAGMAMINDAMPALKAIATEMANAAQEGGILLAILRGIQTALTGTDLYKANKEFTELVEQQFALQQKLDQLRAKPDPFFGISGGAGRGDPKGLLEQEIAKIDVRLKALQALRDSLESQQKADDKPLIDPAWKKQYDELVKALGLGKKATNEVESAYLGLIKALEEKLLLDNESTEVEKLMFALDHLRADQYKQLTIEQLANLEATAHGIDLKNADKKAIESETKALMDYAQWLEKVKGELAAAIAAEDVARNAAIKSASNQAELMELETKLIGATNVERETEIFLLQATKDKLDEATIARMKEAIAAKHAAKEAHDSQVDMWRSVESAGHQAFLSIFDTSKSVLERIRDMLKTHLIDILYQLTFKKFAINLVVSTSGAAVAESVFGAGAVKAATGGGGSEWSILGAANSLGSIFGGTSLTTAFSNFGTAISTYSMMTAEGASSMAALSASTAGLGASFATLIPYVGLAIAAYAILSRDHGPSAVSTGDLGRYYDATGQRTGTDWTTFGVGGAEPVVTSLQQRYAQTVAALGGSAAASNFYFGSNMLEDGTSRNFRLSGGAGGRMYDSGPNETPMNDAALDLAASRAILTALQGSNLPNYLAKYLNTLTAESMDQTAINNAMAFAASIKQIHDALTETRPAVQVLTESAAALAATLNTSADTFKRDFLAAIDAGITPEALANWQRLGSLFDSINAGLMGLVNTATAAQDAIYASLDRVSGIMAGLRDNVTRTAADLAAARADIYNSLRGFGDSISDFLISLRTSGAGTSASAFSALKDLFLSTATLAKAGDVTSQGKLIGIAGPLIEAMRARSTDAVDFARQRATVVSVLQDIEVATKAQAALYAPSAAAQQETAQSRLIAAQLASTEAINTYNRAVELTTGLQLTERTALSDLIDELGVLRKAQDDFAIAQSALATAATAAGVTAETFGMRLGLAGTALADFVARINGLFGPNAGGGSVAQQGYTTYTPDEIRNYISANALDTASEIYDAVVRNNADPYAVGAAYNYTPTMVDSYLAGGGVQRIRGFAEGTPFVPFDMTARIHQGERIIPAASNDELVSEVKALRSAVERLEKPAKETADATRRTKDELQQVVRGGLSIQTRAEGT